MIILFNYIIQNSETTKESSKLKWPQDHVYVGTRRTKPTYDQLDECKWFVGFLRQRQAETGQIIRENMIEYVIEPLQDAIDFRPKELTTFSFTEERMARLAGIIWIQYIKLENSCQKVPSKIQKIMVRRQCLVLSITAMAVTKTVIMCTNISC